MQNLVKTVTALLLCVCFAACKHATSVEGVYKMTTGSIGFSSGSYLSISKKGTDYEVCIQDRSDNSKYTWTAIMQDGKLCWTDKSIPMDISFSDKYATLQTAGGVMGQYKFEKVDVAEEKQLRAGFERNTLPDSTR